MLNDRQNPLTALELTNIRPVHRVALLYQGGQLTTGKPESECMEKWTEKQKESRKNLRGRTIGRIRTEITMKKMYHHKFPPCSADSKKQIMCSIYTCTDYPQIL